MENDLLIFREKQGRIEILFYAVRMGEDLCILISGGDTPHIGAVAVRQVTPGSDWSGDMKMIVLPGHREGEVIGVVADQISSALNKNVAVCCGIHLDKATKDEISIVKEMLVKMTARLIQALSSPNSDQQ
ncbi:hypothetical protein Sgly_2048 [Syntrophobotulus glycolicus DSM 8271]|uniref:Prenylated flavin chaperone LpdD-like domain-containing protein n=1 Tax=Syntrophobotulus glycolicus (strain DSM 8271 / FlGlyR) TaxID=645991 RepID=F0T1K0_SYNGF|nr:hypothetical protein [Syntrophobotulus glycolicus]ADY56341.1 hypothetical protein Sgly_2048 [Syntrophobotulus glycolicus DSM 8271]